MFDWHQGPNELAVSPLTTAAPSARAKPRTGAFPILAEAGLATSLLAATLDEIDYGLLIVDSTAEVIQCNRAGQTELADHPLRLLGNRLRAHELRDMVPLHRALLDACVRGRRRMLIIGAPQQRRTLAVVPLQSGREPGSARALVMLARREVCVCLSVEAFARAHRLTWAETRVLKALAGGARPNQIALEHEVEVSTVRSQLRAIRAKTGCSDIGSLLRQVALLPPMVGALREDTVATEPHDRVSRGHFGVPAPAVLGLRRIVG